MNSDILPSIQLITNTNDRLEQFKQMFEHFHSRGACKKNKDVYVFRTDQKIQNPKDKVDQTFNMLQAEAYRKGFSTNCYCFSIK